MIKHLEKKKLLSICFTRAAKILQHFSNILFLEYIIIQHIPEIKKALNKREMDMKGSFD